MLLLGPALGAGTPDTAGGKREACWREWFGELNYALQGGCTLEHPVHLPKHCLEQVQRMFVVQYPVIVSRDASASPKTLPFRSHDHCPLELNVNFFWCGCVVTCGSIEWTSIHEGLVLGSRPACRGRMDGWTDGWMDGQMDVWFTERSCWQPVAAADH